MKNNKEKLKKMIENSILPDQYRELWYEFIDHLKDDQTESIIEAIEDDEENIHFLTKNMLEKAEILGGNNKDRLDKILEEEKIFIQKEKREESDENSEEKDKGNSVEL